MAGGSPSWQDYVPAATFEYEGVSYFLDVAFFYRLGDAEYQTKLAFSHIHDFEMHVSLNRLFSDGFIVYDDTLGDVARMLNVFDIECQVALASYNQESGKLDDKDRVLRRFVVDNIEIVEKLKDERTVRYCIHLTGVEYLGLLNHVSYSDYDLADDKRKNVVELVRTMLTKYGKLDTDESFNQIGSGVRLNYASGGNDTVQTAVEYLMQKQFFYPDSVDRSMKFLTFDLVSGKYGVFQIGASAPPSAGQLVISMNNTLLEGFFSKSNINLASSSTVRKSGMYIPMSRIVTRTYDAATNTFPVQEYSSARVTGFFGQQDENKLRPLEHTDRMNIAREASEWSNDFNVYYDFVDAFMNWDSVIVNFGGALGRKLMSVVKLEFDNEVDMSTTTTKGMGDDLSRYEQFMGSWYVTDIRYIIKGDRGMFTQNLQLSRPNNEK